MTGDGATTGSPAATGVPASPVGLRRFARAPAGDRGSGTVPPPGAVPPRSAGLPRIGQRRQDATERCEMCAEPIAHDHPHLVDLERRALACTCRGCYLLFTADGAGNGRYRQVPDRVHHDPSAPLTPAEFDELQVPVSVAFFFVNSALSTNSAVGRVVGCYPSPGGATECELDLAAWDRLAERHPLLAAVTPDVEALLVYRSADAVEAFLVPIDVCYALAGEVRTRWSGIDGGDRVRQALDRVLADLRSRARPLVRSGGA